MVASGSLRFPTLPRSAAVLKATQQITALSFVENFNKSNLTVKWQVAFFVNCCTKC